MPRVSLAVELIGLLNELGETDRAQRDVREIRQYLDATANVIDPALLDWSDESAAEAIGSAETQVHEHPSGESYLKLGRTLVLVARPEQRDYRSKLQQAESAFRRAVELEPRNPRTWAALFRFLVAVSPDPIESQRLLASLAERPEITELNRAFTLAQLHESIGSKAAADASYRESLRLVRKQPVLAEQLIVYERSAQYFRAHRPDLAEDCCRRALDIDPAALGPLRILLELRLDQHTVESVREALELIEQMRKYEIDGDTEKRLEAQVLLLAADLGAADPAESRRRGIERLKGLTNTTSQDALLLAEFYLSDNQRAEAISNLRLVVDTIPADVDQLLRFLRVHDEQLYDDTRLRLLADRLYDRLEGIPAFGLQTLDLRLETTGRRTHGEFAQRQSMASAMITRYARGAMDQTLDPDRQVRVLSELMGHLLRTDRWDHAWQLTRVTPELLPGTGADVALATALARADVDDSRNRSRVAQIGRMAAENLNDERLQFAMGNLQLTFGDYRAAITSYRRCLELAPKHAMTHNNLALALAYQDASRLPECFEQLEQAIQIGGRKATFLDSLAILHLLANDPRAAVECLLEASAEGSGDAMIFLHLAVAWLDCGDQNRAQYAFAMAVRREVSRVPLLPFDRDAYQRLQLALSEGGQSE